MPTASVPGRAETDEQPDELRPGLDPVEVGAVHGRGVHAYEDLALARVGFGISSRWTTSGVPYRSFSAALMPALYRELRPIDAS